MSWRRARWLVLGVVAVPVAVAAVLGVEVLLAVRGPDLPDGDPLGLDGLVGADRPGEPLRMVWLGDSTAAGVGASTAAGALPRQVARELVQASGRPVLVTSLAVSGATTAEVAEEQAPRLAELEPDVVLVSSGANDVTHLTPASTLRARYRGVLDAVPAGAEVVLLGVPDMGAIPRLLQPLRYLAGLRGNQLDSAVEDLAAEAGVAYVDIAGETGPAFRSDPGRFFAADRYHPSDDGYARWADAVTDVLVAEVLR